MKRNGRRGLGRGRGLAGLCSSGGPDRQSTIDGRRSRLRSAGIAAGAALLLAAPVAAQQPPLPDRDSLIAYLDSMYRSQSSHSIMTMTILLERGTRKLTLEAWTKGEKDALVVIRAPAREAGTATLMTKDGLWNYAPRADRLIRIPTGLLSESWMGSHFTNDDLMRETSYNEDYTSTLSWTERDGTRYLQVTMTPKPDAPVVYTKLVFLLTPDDWVPVLWEYYDQGKVVRDMKFSDVRTVSGRKLPMRLELQPMDKPDEHTIVQYDEMQLNVTVNDDLFTRRGLRRVAGS
jgi:outer membrane lipoprotein-sorting protein